MLMLSFIFLVNAWIIFAEKVPQAKESFVGKMIFKTSAAAEETETEFNPKAYEEISWGEILKEQRHLLLFLNLLGLAAILTFALGLFLDIRILMARLKRKEILQAAGRHFRVKWGIWDAFKLAIAFVFLGYIIHIIEANFLSSSEGKDKLSFIPLLNAGIMDLALLGFILYFVKVKYKQALAALGLKIKGAVKHIFLAILSYIAFLPVLTFLLLLLILLAALLNYQPPQQAIFKLFLQEKRLWLLIYSTAMVVILGPFVEEVFFRGFAYNAVKRRWGAPKAAVLTAVVFAALHGNLIGFFPIMALGLLLAYMYEKTGSLISSITIHVLHNGLMIMLLFMARYFVRFAQ